MSRFTAPAPPVALASRSLPLEGPSDLLGRLPDPHGIVWLRRGEGFVAWGVAARFDPGTGEGRFRRAAAWASETLEASRLEGDPGLPGPIVFGRFTFDEESPGSWLVVPAVVIGTTGARTWITLTSAGEPPGPGALPGPGGLEPDPQAFPPVLAEEAWLRAVGAAREAIRWGRIEKVVLARDLVVRSPRPLDPRRLARRLAAAYPECYTFSGRSFVGATPELLVHRRGRSVVSVTLGGSAARGDDPDADARLAADLLASAKDRHEHDLAVATVEQALAPLCASLQVDPEPGLLRLANVQHLTTRVEGRLLAGLSALELAGALHPTAAVGGFPKGAALATIRRLEGSRRGGYAGPVGWMDAAGDGEWAIALRCAEVWGATARLLAGAGIVADSDPAAELEETRVKLRAMLSALEA